MTPPRPPRKGNNPLSAETKAKISASLKGRPSPTLGMKHTDETKEKLKKVRRGPGNAFYGRKHSEEAKRRMSEKKKGTKTGSTNPRYGKKRTDEEKRKISLKRVELGIAKGDKNPNWRGGVSRGRSAEMQTAAYKNWRKSVFERDVYTCQFCGQKGGDLHADHIKPWAFFPELRYDVKNGRTLCVSCHKTTYKEALKWRLAGSE